MIAVIRCRFFCLPVCYPDIKITIYINVILTVVLYGCETWSLTLTEERRITAFVNRALRKIFGPVRDEVTGKLRKLHNEEFNDLNSSLNIIWVIKSRRIGGGACSSYGGRGKVHTGVWWGNLRERDQLDDPGVKERILLRWIFGNGMGDTDWIDLAHDRNRYRALVNAVMNRRVLQNSVNFLAS